MNRRQKLAFFLFAVAGIGFGIVLSDCSTGTKPTENKIVTPQTKMLQNAKPGSIIQLATPMYTDGPLLYAVVSEHHGDLIHLSDGITGLVNYRISVMAPSLGKIIAPNEQPEFNNLAGDLVMQLSRQPYRFIRSEPESDGSSQEIPGEDEKSALRTKLDMSDAFIEEASVINWLGWKTHWEAPKES